MNDKSNQPPLPAPNKNLTFQEWKELVETWHAMYCPHCNMSPCDCPNFDNEGNEL